MKKLFILLLSVIVASPFAASANVDITSFAPGMSIIQVKQTIGEPDRCKKYENGWLYIYRVTDDAGTTSEIHAYFAGDTLCSVFECQEKEETRCLFGEKPELKKIEPKKAKSYEEELTSIQTGYLLTETEQKQKFLANVHKHMGIFIFVDNEPVCAYTVVDRIKVNVSWSGEYEGVRDHLLKKVIKSNPDADGVILDLSDGGSDWATVIKFADPQEREKWGFARVHSYNGFYIYCDCEPINDYTIIGRSKSAFSGSGQYDSVKASLVKNTLKTYPNTKAQGIILNLHRGGVDRAIIIKF